MYSIGTGATNSSAVMASTSPSIQQRVSNLENCNLTSQLEEEIQHVCSAVLLAANDRPQSSKEEEEKRLFHGRSSEESMSSYVVKLPGKPGSSGLIT